MSSASSHRGRGHSDSGSLVVRKERERSVADDEGFAEDRHRHDGGALLQHDGRRHGLGGGNAYREKRAEKERMNGFLLQG